MTPHREPEPSARDQHPPCLREGRGRGAPDAAEAGHHVEAVVLPRERVHVADPQVAGGQAVLRDGDQPVGGVDAGDRCPAQGRQLQGETGTARKVEQPVTVGDAEPVVHRDVLARVRRLAQRRELGRPAAPSLVDEAPGVRIAIHHLSGHTSNWPDSSRALTSVRKRPASAPSTSWWS